MTHQLIHPPIHLSLRSSLRSKLTLRVPYASPPPLVVLAINTDGGEPGPDMQTLNIAVKSIALGRLFSGPCYWKGER